MGKRYTVREHTDKAIYIYEPAVNVLDTNIKRYRKMIAFGWYGGKFSHLDWLLPLSSKMLPLL